MPREFIFIGLTGCPGVGKDSVAEILRTRENAIRIGLADPLRKIAEVLDPIVEVPVKVLGFRVGTRRLRISVALQRYGGWDRLKRLAPDVRGLLQRIGHEMGRELFGEEFWVDRLWQAGGKHLRGSWGSYGTDTERVVIVVPDIRYPNEWRESLTRGLTLATYYGARFIAELWEVTRPGYNPVNRHASEQYEALTEYRSRVLSNTGTLEDLDSLVGLVYEKALHKGQVAV